MRSAQIHGTTAQCTVAKTGLGFALNSEVGFLVEDRFNEWRRISNQKERGTSLHWSQQHTGGIAGAQLAGARLARCDQKGQRPWLVTQVAARRRIEEAGGSRRRVHGATGHSVRLRRMEHLGAALCRVIGSEHRQPAFRPQSDTQGQHQRQHSPDCALRTHLTLFSLRPKSHVCDLGHSRWFDDPCLESFKFVDALKVASFVLRVVPDNVGILVQEDQLEEIAALYCARSK